MTIEKHPAEIALALLRDFPEIDEARMRAEGSNRPQQFRQYARPIIDAYFAPLGEKLCRPPHRIATDDQSSDIASTVKSGSQL